MLKYFITIFFIKQQYKIKGAVMEFDEGYEFGLGLFETILVKDNFPILLDMHLERLNKSLEFFEICKSVSKNQVLKYIDDKKSQKDFKNIVLKIIVSEKNIIFKTRTNNYNKEKYENGFYLKLSDIKRNNTSPFVYHKTLNYGECIKEKRRALKNNIDDYLFLNYENNICECSTCNIFLVKENKIYTPNIECGILNGVIREFLIKNYEIIEKNISFEEIRTFDECFVTNSIMGIMPVNKVENVEFKNRNILNIIKKEYEDKCFTHIVK